MRQKLLDYLMDALEDGDRQRVEKALRSDPTLQQELETLRESLEPLDVYRGDFDPPDGLADATCQLVAEHRTRNETATAASPTVSPSAVPSTARAARLSSPAAQLAEVPRLTEAPEPPARRSRWTFSDLSVAGGVLIAAGLLLVPAIDQSRSASHRTTCQNNLSEVGRAAIEYSGLHELGYFPEIAADGNLAAAGVFPVRLLDAGLLSSPRQLVCPTSRLAHHLAQGGQLPATPSLDELRKAKGKQLLRYHLTMGGDYAYPLGNMENEAFQTGRNLHRPSFPIVADAPRVNHGGSGQNVLSEDGSVRWTTSTFAGDYNDDFYVNDVGVVAAGRHVDDAVLAPSPVRPFPFYLNLKPAKTPSPARE